MSATDKLLELQNNNLALKNRIKELEKELQEERHKREMENKEAEMNKMREEMNRMKEKSEKDEQLRKLQEENKKLREELNKGEINKRQITDEERGRAGKDDFKVTEIKNYITDLDNISEEEKIKIKNEAICKPPPTIKDFNKLCSLSKNALRNIITMINLSSKNLNKDDAVELSTVILPYCEKLNTLYLGDNPGFGDEGAVAVAGALSSYNFFAKCLNSLGFQCDNLTDKGALAIAAVLPELKSLKELFLGGNKLISFSGKKAINESVASDRKWKLTIHWQ